MVPLLTELWVYRESYEANENDLILDMARQLSVLVVALSVIICTRITGISCETYSSVTLARPDYGSTVASLSVQCAASLSAKTSSL